MGIYVLGLILLLLGLQTLRCSDLLHGLAKMDFSQHPVLHVKDELIRRLMKLYHFFVSALQSLGQGFLEVLEASALGLLKDGNLIP